MSTQFFKLLTTRYPQNYILRNPYRGALFVGLFTFFFTVLYHPLTTSANPFSYEITMAIYSFAIALPLVLLIKLLMLIPYFSPQTKWTFGKELFIETVILSVMGIYVFFLGFIIEAPADRWNVPTFIDSCKNTFLIGVLPYLFFTIQGYKYLVSPSRRDPVDGNINGKNTATAEELKIQINSKLKKDKLSFSPQSFLYAESDGNYVNFYLWEDQKTCKKMIRNSITNVESQLSEIPYFLRTHRAFIVNLKKITQKQGNSSGYRLNLEGVEVDLPVSRQNVAIFDQVAEQFSL